MYRNLQDLPFYQDIIKINGEIYSVGGKVRDELLGLESKDLDILISNVEEDKLIGILSKYGKVDTVGKSFGIIKLKLDNFDYEIDIALPRKDIPFIGVELLIDNQIYYLPIDQQISFSQYYQDFPKDIKRKYDKKFNIGSIADKELDIEYDGNIWYTNSEMSEIVRIAEKYNVEYTIRDGYTGFISIIDPYIDIETDLERRDFTICSIAKDSKGRLIDPFNGIQDLLKKEIKATSIKSFKEDPLRMLRAIQFASRFNFKFEAETLNSIKNNKDLINKIPIERIIIELEKIVSKCNIGYAIRLLIKTGLFKEIFGFYPNHNSIILDNVSRLSELIYILCEKNVGNLSDYYTKTFNNYSIETCKEIKSLIYYYNNIHKMNGRILIYEMYKISKNTLKFTVLNTTQSRIVNKFKKGVYPLTFKDLPVNGYDLMRFNINGKDIKICLEHIMNMYLIKHFNKETEKTEILNYIRVNYNLIFNTDKV